MSRFDELQQQYANFCAQIGDKIYKILVDIEQIKILSNEANELKKTQGEENVITSTEGK